MKSTSEKVTVVTYSSDVLPEVSSTIESHGDTIAWADAHEVVWKIVNASKSAPYGWKSSTYIGWAQGNPSVAAMLARVEAFRRELEHPVESLWSWRAHFTLERYGSKGFKGGFFTQYDAQHQRGCVQLHARDARGGHQSVRGVVRRFAWEVRDARGEDRGCGRAAVRR